MNTATDPSTGHHPVTALWIKNPELYATAGEARAILESGGQPITARSLTMCLNHLTRTDILQLEDGQYHLRGGACPLTRAQKHASYQREVTKKNRAIRESGGHVHLPPSKRKPSPAEKQRQMRTVRHNRQQQIGRRILETLGAATEPLTERELKAVIGGNPARLRQALTELGSSGQLHSSVSPNQASKMTQKFWLPLSRTPKRSPGQFDDDHQKVISRAERASGAITLSEVAAELPELSRAGRWKKVIDLFHAGKILLTPVGATVVLHAVR